MLAQLQITNFWGLLTSILDIAVVAYATYRVLIFIRGTRAVPLIQGIILVFLAIPVSGWLHLTTVHWLLTNLRVGLLVALPVVFQPELRRALEQMGRGKLFARPVVYLGEEEVEHLLAEVGRAVSVMSRNKIGALIVFEGETGLEDIIETGTRVDGLVSAELLINVFIPNTPLHDGAVVIRGDRVMAAGCFLPLSEEMEFSRELGTRHRAAVGMSEHSDAAVLVVSEETGGISLARGGKLFRNLDENTLKEMLLAVVRPRSQPSWNLWMPWGQGG